MNPIRAITTARALRQQLAKQKRAAREPMVGIWWALPKTGPTFVTNPTIDDVIVVAVGEPLSDVPVSTIFKDSPYDHVTTWPAIEQTRPDVADLQYDDFPRGRVTYNVEDGQFLLLCSSSANQPDLIRRIKSKLMIPSSAKIYIDDRDIHYQRPRMPRLAPLRIDL